MAVFLLDKLGVESLYIIKTSRLSLYANGKTNDTVVNMGYQTTTFISIYEGFILIHAVTKVDTGGKDLTDFFCHIIGLRSDNDKFIYEGQKSMINELKEKFVRL